MSKSHLYQKNFPTEMDLRPVSVNFLRAFSLDDVEKYDLCAHKNAKYLFYRFNDYVKAYGSQRLKIRHTRKFKDSVGMQEAEERSKLFLVEKIVHGVEFKNPYNIEVEKITRNNRDSRTQL